MAKLSDKPLHGGIDLASRIIGFFGGVLGRFDLATIAKASGHMLDCVQSDGTAALIILDEAPGAVFHGSQQLITFRAIFSKPAETGVSIRYAPIVDEDRALVHPDGTPVLDGAWIAGQKLTILYNPEGWSHAGKYQLINPPKPSGKVFDIPVIQSNVSGDDLDLQPFPGAILPNNTAAKTRFRFTIITGNTGPMRVRVKGINDVDWLELRLPDGVSQIPAGAFPPDSLCDFERIPDGHYRLMDDPTVTTGLSRDQIIMMRNAQNNAARALAIARKAL